MRNSSSAGFSTIEVIIAVILLAAVATAVTFAMVGGTRTRGVARLQASLTAAGAAAQEDIAGNRDWMKTCTSIDKPCDVKSVVTADSLKMGDVGGEATLQSAQATPLDSTVDGTGSSDKDGVVPDFYRIEIVIDASTVASKYGLDPDKTVRHFTTVIDRRGNVQSGSLTIQACDVVNQADERMSIQGCATSGQSDIKMAGCPPDSSADKMCPAAAAAFGNSGPSSSGPSWYVSMKPAPLGSGVRVKDVSTGQTYAPTSTSGGILKFDNIPASGYIVQGLPSTYNGHERWKTKEVPSFHGSSSDPVHDASVTVEPGIRNQAFVLFRPTKASGLNLKFQRVVHNYRLNPSSTTEWLQDDWTPMSSYTSASADAACQHMRDIAAFHGYVGWESFSYTCQEVVEGVPSPNCVTLYVHGTYPYGPVSSGYDFKLTPKGYVASVAPLGPEESGIKQVTVPDDTVGAVFCGFFREKAQNLTYVAGAPTSQTRDGAAVDGAYWVWPEPYGRHVDTSTSGPFLETPVCYVKWQGQCTSGSPARHEVPLQSSVKPGVNSQMQRDEASAGDPKFHDYRNSNHDLRDVEPWVLRPLYFSTSGTIFDASGGAHSASATQTMIGTGECYWFGGLNNLSNEMGACDKCYPEWSKDQVVSGACAILYKTNLARYAKEDVVEYTFASCGGCSGSGLSTMTPTVANASTNPLPTANSVINYSPVWACTSTYASIKSGSATCKAWQSVNSTINVPGTTYHSTLTNGTPKINPTGLSGGGMVH